MDVEGQAAPQVVEIDNPRIPPDPHQVESETATKAAFEVPGTPESITLVIV